MFNLQHEIKGKFVRAICILLLFTDNFNDRNILKLTIYFDSIGSSSSFSKCASLKSF